jgi:hypothetical protein
MSPKFTNKQFFTTLILILIPTLIFFANIKTSRAAPLGVDLATSINSAFASNSINPLTNQQIIDNGCKQITSELVQNTENEKLFLPADLNALIKTHKGILTTNQNKVLPILTGFQNQITNATAPIDYNVLNGFIDDLYISLIDVTNPVQDSNNSLYDTFELTSDVSSEVVDPELDYFIGNQDFSIEYMYNSLDATQEDINNDLTKDNYTKAEAQVFFDDIKFLLEDEFLNMQDRTDEIIAELDNGFGTIKDVFVSADEECVFILNDIFGLEAPVTVPIIKQYVCDSLYLADAANVQYNSGNCLVYK